MQLGKNQTPKLKRTPGSEAPMLLKELSHQISHLLRGVIVLIDLQERRGKHLVGMMEAFLRDRKNPGLRV